MVLDFMDEDSIQDMILVSQDRHLNEDRLELRGRSGETLAVRRFEHRLSAGSHHPDWFGGVADSFLAEIRERPARKESLAAAVACAEILEACRASSRDGGRPRRLDVS